jgi:dienelactone hydrolase
MSELARVVSSHPLFGRFLAKAYPRLVTVQLYPGAYHGFDIPGEMHRSVGHILAYNTETTADARVDATEFLRRFKQ